jgi:hypothetical protein
LHSALVISAANGGFEFGEQFGERSLWVVG